MTRSTPAPPDPAAPAPTRPGLQGRHPFRLDLAPRDDAARDPSPQLAVALHDVEPATYRRCVDIREWLDDFGIQRVTLLVIPAPRLHPFPARSPELAYWLLDRQDAGDAIAQHGLQHRQTRRGPLLNRPVRRRQGGRTGRVASSCVPLAHTGRGPRRPRSRSRAGFPRPDRG